MGVGRAKGTGVGAPENKTRSSPVVLTQVHSRTRVSWLLLAALSKDHLSLDSERWRRCGPPLHPRTQMTSAIEPQGWDSARCPAARAHCTGPGVRPAPAGHGSGPPPPRPRGTGIIAQGPPPSQGGGSCRRGGRGPAPVVFRQPGGLGAGAGRAPGRRSPGLGRSVLAWEPLVEGQGVLGAQCTQNPALSLVYISGAMAGVRILLCLGVLLARQGSAGKGLATLNLGIQKPQNHIRQDPPKRTWRGKVVAHQPKKNVLTPPPHFPFTDLGPVAIGEVHEDIRLHCGNVTGPRGLVTWYRTDSEPVFLLSSNSSLPPAAPRFTLEDAAALHIEALSLQDDGNYSCQEVLNETRWFPVWLRVASGPTHVDCNISATGALPNGTLYATKGSQVDFSCRSAAQPPPEVEWWIQAHNISEFLGKNLSDNSFTLMLMSQNLQGNYTCLATNVLSGRQRKVTTELLVYWPPSSAPQCSVEVSSDSATLELTCSWDGGYPDPTFLWTEEPGGTIVGNSKLQTLSPSQLSEGKKFKCVGSHIVGPESGASCVVQISSPLLESQPMKTCFVGSSVTLTCQVTGANPPARIQWLRNRTHPGAAVEPGPRHLITQHGQSSSLTIHSCSQDLDGGFYVCRAENLVGVRAVDIWLSVKEPLNIGAIVGTVVSLLLLGLAIVSGLMLYYSPVFCWKAGSTFRGQDMGDVMVLVDSEEEEEEEDKEDVVEEVEHERNEGEEMPRETSKYGRVHRVTALINGNLDRMCSGLQELQDDSGEQQSDSDIAQEEDKPV
ncbi:V-set and immunoglobulin domain-containing protein 10 [Acomys russatus]|uniref:V-set and immunoglobulin domain-containing protein 10 n=1 Tax=Acomys russatus TaxID=60746 RepID=UPI0021E270B9|nr:V-set and immunoglobulin domain-containing protein 10 [Acomys russatus]